MTNYNLSALNRDLSTIPAKTRTVSKSPLYTKMEHMGIGEAFVIEKAEMSSVAANVYATAKRAGIKVTLRQLPEGVGVWRVRNVQPRTDVEATKQAAPPVPARGRRTATKAAATKAVATNGRKSKVGTKTLVKARKRA